MRFFWTSTKSRHIGDACDRCDGACINGILNPRVVHRDPLLPTLDFLCAITALWDTGVVLVHNNGGRRSIATSPGGHGGLHRYFVTQRPSDKPVSEQNNPWGLNSFSGIHLLGYLRISAT
jgi:hypothetical protein